MKRLSLHLAVFAAGALLTGLAWPQNAPARRHGLNGIYQDLGLMPLVGDELRKLDDKVGRQCREMGEKRSQLYRELKKDAHDPGVADRLVREIGEIRGRIQRDMVEHLVGLKPRLTPAQREALFDRLAAGDVR